MNVEIGTERPCNSFSGNICFEFSLLCLCSASTILKLEKEDNLIKLGFTKVYAWVYMRK
jgi:hypothetical protein